MQWFVEEKGHDGSWHPVIYHGDKPSAKGTDRHKVWRADPVPVPEVLIGFQLQKIASCLSLDGEFAGVDMDAVAEFFREGFVLPKQDDG